MKYIYWYLSILSTLIITNALPNNPGTVPVPGKPVYIKESNSLWVFSFSRNTQAGNKLFYIDLNKSFDTLDPPVTDISTKISNSQCPVMHFAQAYPSADGVNINIFGAGSDTNGVYDQAMTICQYNTKTDTWRQIISDNAPVARRNAAIAFSATSNLTFFFGGSSEAITGLSASSPNYPSYWPRGVSMFDSYRQVWVSTEPQYTIGSPRANATMTEISDTNGQLVILGGAIINNSSSVDMVTNFPLANMSDVIVLDPRTSVWSSIKTIGDTAPIGRKHHTTTLHPDGHTLIVIGGEFFNQTGAYLLNDVWILDTRDMNNYQWSQPPIQGVGLYRSNHTSILIGDQIWVIAGTNASAKAVDIQLLNVTDWSWSYSAVSKYVPPEQYASIGGIKGLIGIIVGVVGAVLLLVSCAVVWWCRRRRIKPTNKNQPPAVSPGQMVYYGGSDGSYQDSYQIHQQDQHQQMYSDYPQQADMSTTANSKITSRPSMSTTTSHNNMISDWSNQHPTLTNSFNGIPPPNINTSNYYVPQPYTNGLPPPMTPTSPTDHNQFYDENYYTDSNNNMYNSQNDLGAIPGYTTGVAVPSGDGNQRHSFSYWDAPPRFSPDTANFPSSAADNNYFLTPVGLTSDNLPRSSARAQTSQQLQKPNELDTNLVTSPEVSTTVYTGSTAASTATPAHDSTRSDQA